MKHRTGKGIVSKHDWGEQWPFTFDDGIVKNDRDSITITDTSTGETYALNGPAMLRGYSDIDPVWMDNETPGFEGTKIPLAPFMRFGLLLC